MRPVSVTVCQHFGVILMFLFSNRKFPASITIGVDFIGASCGGGIWFRFKMHITITIFPALRPREQRLSQGIIKLALCVVKDWLKGIVFTLSLSLCLHLQRNTKQSVKSTILYVLSISFFVSSALRWTERILNSLGCQKEMLHLRFNDYFPP